MTAFVASLITLLAFGSAIAQQSGTNGCLQMPESESTICGWTGDCGVEGCANKCAGMMYAGLGESEQILLIGLDSSTRPRLCAEATERIHGIIDDLDDSTSPMPLRRLQEDTSHMRGQARQILQGAQDGMIQGSACPTAEEFEKARPRLEQLHEEAIMSAGNVTDETDNDDDYDANQHLLAIYTARFFDPVATKKLLLEQCKTEIVSTQPLLGFYGGKFVNQDPNYTGGDYNDDQPAKVRACRPKDGRDLEHLQAKIEAEEACFRGDSEKNVELGTCMRPGPVGSLYEPCIAAYGRFAGATPAQIERVLTAKQAMHAECMKMTTLEACVAHTMPAQQQAILEVLDEILLQTSPPNQTRNGTTPQSQAPSPPGPEDAVMPSMPSAGTAKAESESSGKNVVPEASSANLLKSSCVGLAAAVLVSLAHAILSPSTL